MPMSPRLLRPVGLAYHPEALAWRAAVVANGGSVGLSLQAVSDFCTAIDAAGIRSKFLRLSLVCGGNLSAARVPLYRAGASTGTQYGNATDTNVGPFVSADYGEATGLNGNGASKYFDTGLTIGTAKTFGADYDNCHVAVYNRTSQNGPHFGAYDFGNLYFTNALAIDAGTSVGVIADYVPVLRAGNVNYGEAELVGSSTGYGFHLGVKTGDTAGAYELNGTDITDSSSSYGMSFETTDASPLFFMGVSDGENLYAACDGRLSHYSVGQSLTGPQRAAYYAAVLAFQTALGRNV
jgi:hypothetical protein